MVGKRFGLGGGPSGSAWWQVWRIQQRLLAATHSTSQLWQRYRQRDASSVGWQWQGVFGHVDQLSRV